MPLLSVIVPVFKVQGYLRQCLESILDQDFRDLELIVVNDCSPDHSGDIIDEYAARDSRVRALHLERNVGLGRARNAGLAVATGDYVWFIDSDDWLVDGCLQQVAERLDGSLDMLVVDYARANPVGPTRRSWASKEVRDIPPGEVFKAVDRPQILRVVHFAWNRVLRRQFLIDQGLDEFFEGWYEDISWSFPCMAKSERISFLDTPCVNYRQRRGSITKSSGDRHLEFFDQWAYAFDRIGRTDPLWEQVFARFVWHTLMVLENGTRLPNKAARHKFFARGTEFYRRYQPAQPVAPAVRELQWGGIKAKQAQWLAAGDFRSFERRHSLKLLKSKVKGKVKKAVKLPKSLVKMALGWRLGLIGRLYYEVQARRPVIPNLALFDVSWGLGYGCNPAAVYEQTRVLAPHIDAVFMVRPDRVDAIPAGVPYVVRGTFAYYRALARAKYMTTNVNFPNFVHKRRGSVHLQTQHGTPLKSMGIDQQHYPGGAHMDHEAMLRRVDRWDFCISSNPLSTEVWERSFPARYEQLEYGYPRNDRLALATDADVAKARADLGVDPGDLVILYAPTHRSHDPQAAPPFDAEALLAALGDRDGRVLLRDHHLVTYAPGDDDEEASGSSGTRTAKTSDRILDVSTHPCIEDLYLAADVLVVDYSSAMFDYAVLDRPIVIYAPDWEEYRIQRGVNFDLMQQRPGPVAMDFDELCKIFAESRYADSDSTRVRRAFRERFCPWDDGHAGERVVRRVFLGDTSVQRPPSAVRQDARV